MILTPTSLASAGEVLSLFLIPLGFGVPGGVLLAKARGLEWPIMMGLYFVSDVILAFVFEPLLLNFAYWVKRYKFLANVRENYLQMMQRMKWPSSPGPFALVMISFIFDPMTGRTAALAAGHGFISGWIIAILGDMITFTLLMASTLWIDSFVGGNKTLTMLAVATVMIALHFLIKRLRQSRLLRRT